MSLVALPKPFIDDPTTYKPQSENIFQAVLLGQIYFIVMQEWLSVLRTLLPK